MIPDFVLFLHKIQQGCIANRGMLNDFGEALVKFSLSQSIERLHIGENESRLVERTDQVFAFRRVDSRFATYGAVYLTDDSCWNLHTGNATLKNRCRKPRKITNHAATKRN